MPGYGYKKILRADAAGKRPVGVVMAQDPKAARGRGAGSGRRGTRENRGRGRNNSSRGRGRDRSSSAASASSTVPAQGQARPHGFVFMCSDSTQDECLRKGLFGGPAKDLKPMSDIVPLLNDPTTQREPPTPLFLFNFSKRQMTGVFFATSLPALNVVKEAWGGKFPAQVRITRAKKPFFIADRDAPSRSVRYQAGPLRTMTQAHDVLKALGINIESFNASRRVNKRTQRSAEASTRRERGDRPVPAPVATLSAASAAPRPGWSAHHR